MAKALGAKVAPGPAKEIGWAPVELMAAGRASPLRHLEGLDVLHWHRRWQNLTNDDELNCGQKCRWPLTFCAFGNT
jgi:hypothetical protein